MIKQPKDSKLCGQCCVATLLNISLSDSIRLVGHKKGTYGKELIKILNNKYTVSKNKKGAPTNFSICIIRNDKFKNWGHWVIYDRGYYYDPIFGKYIKAEEFFNLYSEGTRVTSHWEIENPPRVGGLSPE